MSLALVPLKRMEAQAFIAATHRHHKPALGDVFRVGVAERIGASQLGKVVGVATCGRPVSRMMDDGWTLEVNRTCTDGYPNANSMLYGACRRAAWALGYKRLVTYTLPSESGASLRAAGFVCIGEAGGGSWSRIARPRIDTHPEQTKLRWEATR